MDSGRVALNLPHPPESRRPSAAAASLPGSGAPSRISTTGHVPVAGTSTGLCLNQKFYSLDTMGRRKSKRKPPPKKKMTGDLESQFTCPFCNHEKSCDVKMERSRNTGIISCSVCLEEFQTPITYLSEPVDVYSDWIDACEAANQ
ncbi:transcription elongation factor 1 homolog isoform X1 [Oryzias latipes]